MKDVNTIAANLLDGGWTPEDKADMMAEYELTEEEADEIIEEMKKFQD